MAFIVVCSKNFAFGPTGKLLTIVRPLIEAGHIVTFIGYGSAYQLASKERFREILRIDPKDPFFAYFTHMLVKQADLVISDEERRIIDLAQRFGIKNIYIDAQFWHRDKMPDETLLADTYIVQKSFDHSKNFAKYARRMRNLQIVEPIIDLSAAPLVTTTTRQLMIGLGGMEGGSYFRLGVDSHYPHIMLQLLAQYGEFEMFDTVLVTGNERVLRELAPTITRLNPKFTLQQLPHERFLRAIAASSMVMITPGLETTLEAFAYHVPTIFLPPSNDTQYLHLDFLRKKLAACMSVHFADYYPQLTYEGKMRDFFARFLEQLQRFESDVDVQKDTISRVNEFIQDMELRALQLQKQDMFIDELGKNGLKQSLQIVKQTLESTERNAELQETEGVLRWRSTAYSYAKAEEKDGTKQELFSPLLRQELGPVHGQTVLDYGCGDGWFSRELEELGAGRVIGVDLLPEMVDLAQYKTAQKRIDYYHTPTNALTPIEDNSIDQVVANFVFMLSPDERSLRRSFAEIFRVLKPGGRLVYLITHPAFLNRPFHNTERIFSYGPFNYTTKGLRYDVHYRSHRGHETIFQSYHYPLETYFDTVNQSGFATSHFHEVIPPVSFVRKYGFSDDLLTYPQYFLSTVAKPAAMAALATTS